MNAYGLTRADRDRVGTRCLVITPPFQGCPEFVRGAGVVVSVDTEFGVRAEVRFDDGSGGKFPPNCIHREPVTRGDGQ